MLTQVHTNLKVTDFFWGEHGQTWVVQSGDMTLKLTVSEE